VKSAFSNAEARRIALAAQGLASPKRDGAANWTRMAKSIETMGLLQIDSVNVLCRSHYLPVFSRAGAYGQDTLDARTHGGRKRTFFEYWAHEASFLPMKLYPLMRWKMERARQGDGTYEGVHKFAREHRAYVKRTLEEVRARGPTTVSDLTEPGERSGHWWGWSKGKYALEYLFDTGEVTAAKREGFERFYDLPERVIPSDALNAPAPPAREAIRALLDLSGQALGIATEFDLRDYFRLPVADTKTGIAELVEAGRLAPVAVKDWKHQAYLHIGAAIPRKAAAQALVSPFDPICWERDRTERMFGFRYRIEIYTPKPKRVYGYYVLPFLLGDRFAARVCLKADRQAGVLRANAIHLEDGADAGETSAALAMELERMAGWLGLGGVQAGKEGNLAQALGKHLG
jgi:uncharacterized protein